MGRFSMDAYYRQWPRIGGVLAMTVGGATALLSGKLSKTQSLSAANLAALMVHQFEEYVYPGWFPGQLNEGLLKSKQPLNYPLNTRSAMYINAAMGYPVYLAPVLFPKKTWVGLAPVLFGFLQTAWHGVVFPRLSGDRYSPGFLAAALLHTPIGIAYLRALREDGPIERSDWAKATPYTLLIALSIGVGIIAGKDKQSPYMFDRRQMGPYADEAD